MRITIDNADGLGAVEYSSVIAPDGPITIQRKLNQPSRCTTEIVLGLGGLATPARRGRVVVMTDAAATLFTGYLATEPVAVYVGQGTVGPVYRARLSAVSDEWILDKQGSGASASNVNGLSLSVQGPDLLSLLTRRVQSSVGTQLAVAPVTNARATGAFAASPAASWSANAGAAASASYAAYRAMSGTVTVQPAGSVTHAYNDGSGSLDVAELSTSLARELANDVTVSGEEEPAAYVQEIFEGDGTTAVFPLSRGVFRGSNRRLLKDSFTEAAFDTSQWSAGTTSNHLTLTSAGLTLNGGNGYDGQNLLTALNALEMSGFVLAQLGGGAIRCGI